METSIVFPHQLFRHHPALKNDRKVLLVEEWLFFNQYNFHKQKLILHRSTMQFYMHWLERRGYKVEYISCMDEYCDSRKLVAHLAKEKVTHLHYADVCDDWLRRRLVSAAKKYNIKISSYPTPYFLNQPGDVK